MVTNRIRELSFIDGLTKRFRVRPDDPYATLRQDIQPTAPVGTPETLWTPRSDRDVLTMPGTTTLRYWGEYDRSTPILLDAICVDMSDGQFNQFLYGRVALMVPDRPDPSNSTHWIPCEISYITKAELDNFSNFRAFYNPPISILPDVFLRVALAWSSNVNKTNLQWIALYKIPGETSGIKWDVNLPG